MEVEVMISGIGGQGIQLVAKTLSVAAISEAHHVQMSSEIGGEMRGGLSISSVVIGDHPIKALPILDKTSSALIFHHKFSEKVIGNLRPDAVVMLNDSVFEGEIQKEDLQIWRIAATTIAEDMGHPMTAGFVMLGAFNKITGLVSQNALSDAMEKVIPPYRKQHIEANLAALRAGEDSVSSDYASIWNHNSPLLKVIG